MFCLNVYFTTPTSSELPPASSLIASAASILFFVPVSFEPSAFFGVASFASGSVVSLEAFAVLTSTNLFPDKSGFSPASLTSTL